MMIVMAIMGMLLGIALYVGHQCSIVVGGLVVCVATALLVISIMGGVKIRVSNVRSIRNIDILVIALVAIYMVTMALLYSLKYQLTKIVPPRIGAKYLSKKWFCVCYVTNKQTKSTSLWGDPYEKLHVRKDPNNEIVVSLGYAALLGKVYRNTFKILYLGTTDFSVKGARDIIRMIDYLILTYGKINPGSMSIYSARLYWSCIRRAK